MHDLEESQIYCPYCGESLTVLIEPELAGQEYIEDCQVCCRPIECCVIEQPDGSHSLQVRSENE